MRNGKEYTPTQVRMLALLADGRMHTKEELQLCLSDELSGFNAVRIHLTYLRKKLRPIGQDILCEYNQHKYFYRHVRLLASPDG
jgi:DNA-binding response OmpR family regulator